MVQVASEKIQRARGGGGRLADGSSETTSTTLTTTRTTRTSRESIDIESREQRRRPLEQASASGTRQTSGGGSGGGGGGGGYGNAASLAARDSSSPPLSLIDANVASPPSASRTDKSHCQQPLAQPATTTAAATTKTLNAGKLQVELAALAVDKFSRLDQDRFLSSKEPDEVNNNSIQSFCQSIQQQQQQQQQAQRQQQQQQQHLQQTPPQTDQTHQRQQSNNSNQAAKLAPSESIKQPQTQPISPLNLLTGLRMHANNLRSQQQQQQQHHQQLNAKLSSNSSPNSYVESCLNPSEEQQDTGSGGVGGASKVDSRLSNTRAQSSRGPLQGINIIPSYTSIFDKPRVSRQASEGTPSSIPTEGSPQPQQQQSQQQQQQQPINTYSQRSAQSTVAEIATLASSRSPSRKQQTTQFDSLSSSRTLLTTISSIGNKSSSQRQEGANPKKSPYEYLGARSRRPIDYDNQSHSQAEFDLDAASSPDRSQSDPDEDDECDDLEVADAEKSPFRVEVISPNSRARVASRDKLINAADPSGKRQESIRQSNKFPNSASRLNRLMSPNVSSSPSSGKKNINSPSGKRSHLSQYPQAQQTRVSMDDMSRSPTFHSGQMQKQDQTKTTSCRKLDLLEQVAHLDCDCHICLKNRKLGTLYDHLYHHQSAPGLNNGKLTKYNSSSPLKPLDNKYPKTRICHMVLKSIILVLCTLLLLMLLLSVVLLSVHLPKSMDNVMNASRSFNVTIAGRR